MAIFLNIFASFLHSAFYKFCIWIKMQLLFADLDELGNI